jgi:hypothetical protein
MGTPMAFTTGTTYTYTDRMFKRGTIGLNLPATLAPGYNWFNGVDVTSSQYLIYSDTYTTGIASQANSRPTAWTTPDKTDASLLGLINTLPERVGQTSFTATTSALSWLQSTNRYFLINNGYENIVTSGLTLSWDAGWYNSYKTGNTLWYDISGSYVNGTFTNGPSFSSDSGGTISFDGADDYISASVSSPGPPITVETVCRFNNVAADSSNYRYVFSLGNDSTGAMISLAKATSQSPVSPLLPNQGYCYIGNNNPRPINYIFTGSAYHHVVLQVLSDNQTIKSYIDGVEVSVSGDSTTISLSSTLNVGRYVGANWYLNGNIQTFRIYNRVLSQSEILQNYNAQRQRYTSTVEASGGTISYITQNNLTYKVHTFTGDGNFIIGNSSSGDTFEYLLVGGGGGAGKDGAGGGGAGGFVTGTTILSTTTYPISVGAGGAKSITVGGQASDGGPSTFNSITALGGGGGGSKQANGRNGASGGGGGHPATYIGGTGVSGQGFGGGSSSAAGGGGGGGAGAVGANFVTTAGNGGIGKQSSINGILQYYAGGGAGGAWNAEGGTGGLGGGGNGGSGAPLSIARATGQPGTINTGGGGGSAGYDSVGGQEMFAGNGGSGIVIIRYRI